MTEWIRRMQGRSPRPGQREKLHIQTWVKVQESKRQIEAEVARESAERKRPAEQAALLARAKREASDPYSARLRAEAAQLEARKRAEAARFAAQVHGNAARERQAREALRREYGQGAAAAPVATRGRDITRWAAQGVALRQDECSYVHPHSGPCQPRRRA